MNNKKDAKNQLTITEKYYFYCPEIWDRDEAFYKYKQYLETIPDSEDKQAAILDFEDVLEDRESLANSPKNIMRQRNGETYKINSLINQLSFKQKHE